MRSLRLIGLAGMIAAATSSAAAQDRGPSAADIAATPADTLNLRKREIPPILAEASRRPYDLSGLKGCGALAAKVRALNAVLGDDIDVQQARKGGVSAGRVAQSVVGSFIPFGGIIREVSGANAEQREQQAAVQAGIARRSFLKGVGQAKGCPYPARAAR